MTLPEHSTADSKVTWSRSIELLDRAKKSLAGGVSSPFRAKAAVPLYLKSASGSRIFDVDGNSFIDYSLAWGPLILGHCHPALVERLQQQAAQPHIYGAQHELEIEVSESMQRLIPCAERVAFTSSGSEAVQIAWRLARAATGRNLILKFEGHYHGWMDSTLFSYKPSAERLAESPLGRPIPGSLGQVPNAAENVLIAQWNNLASVQAAFREHPGQIAAVVAEPYACNCGCIGPEGDFLGQIAALARSEGALLVFDEVITGFRHPGLSAQAHYGVTPDLATFGKAMGGGLPLSAIAGRGWIMDLMAGGGVVFGGTFNGNPLSLAAARVVLRELTSSRILDETAARGIRLMRGIEDAGRAAGLPMLVTGFGTAFTIHFTHLQALRNYRDVLQDDARLLSQFLLEALREGVNMVPDGRMYLSTAHSESDMEETVSAISRACRRLAAAGV